MDGRRDGRRNGRRESRTRGATLAELLAVMGILSLLLALGIPTPETAATEAKQFTLILMRSMALARRQAVGSGERVTVCGSPDGKHCAKDWQGPTSILVFSDRNRNYQLDENDVLHHAQTLSLQQGRGHWRGSLGRAYMRLRTDGSAVEYGRYSYCPLSGAKGDFRQLVVNRVGRAYQHHDGGGRQSDCA